MTIDPYRNQHTAAPNPPYQVPEVETRSLFSEKFTMIHQGNVI
ncbi:hypothetical protein [Planktothricoides raciborskii]|nr:hypothetical protein [Planktothricoides raciborskii]